ncbi:MAG: S24 family peptidase [Sulfurovaceae bacterium]|nr:S24 family peptidase [Sulfurovaceae bacterium]
MNMATRLKEIRAKQGLTQTEFGDKIGLKQSQIRDIETGKQKVSVDLAETMEKKFNIDGWWLLTGKGQMHSDDVKTIQKDKDTISMPLIRGHVQAGKGNDIDGIRYDIVETMTISKSLFKTPPLGSVRVIKVDGYSMVPMLYPDTFVIFDECHEFRTDGLYIINYDNELMVKLIQIDPRGSIHIKSVNPDYQSWTVQRDEQVFFSIVGKVLRVIF